MLNWLRKIMAGAQDAPVPEGVEVERDEQGRVVRATGTLSHQKEQNRANEPAPEPSKAFAQSLEAAGSWLNLQNIKQIEAHGLHINYDFDQGSGTLNLHYADGATLRCKGQILGSFDPERRTFLWGWANPSLERAVSEAAWAVRAEGEALGEAILTTPELGIKFKLVTQLVAYAAKRSGASCVLRAMVNGHTSVFVAYVPEVGQASQPLPEQVQVDAAEALVAQYNREMSEVDKAYHELAGDHTDLDALHDYLARKDEIYQRDWREETEDWRPSSLGWPSSYDTGRYKAYFTGPDREGGLIIGHAASPGGLSDLVFKVKLFEDGPKIVNQLEYLDGFVWPDHS